MPYGIVRRSRTDQGYTDTIVSPDSIAKALANVEKPLSWQTGLLTPNTLYVGEQGGARIVVEYRKPQVTGIYLEGTDEPLRVPMPGLLLVRTLPNRAKALPTYRVFAVAKRPTSLDARLYETPLPNVSTGGICWGNVPHVAVDKRGEIDLAPDWQLFFGSKFGDHTVSGKSKKYPKDIRKLLLEMDAERVSRYPLKDLRPTRLTLKQVMP